MNNFADISQVLSDVEAGKMVIVVDDEDRENEGDLVMAAEKMTPEAMGFLIRHTGGVVCLCLRNKRADELALPAMVQKNESNRGTGFTVSIEAAMGVTTGISAADRCATVLAAADLQSTSKDLVRPGHIFPLRAKDGGVLVRVGHTEASVDLCRLAKLQPMGVVSELVNDDGSVQKGEQLFAFAKEHGLKICSVADIVKYRLEIGDDHVEESGDSAVLEEKMVSLEAESKLETRFGEFDLQIYKDHVNGREHVVLMSGGEFPSSVSLEYKGGLIADREFSISNFQFPTSNGGTLVRVHSECLTGEAFASTFCDCGGQLELALEMIAKEGGVLLYLRQEGRGIGLANKIKAYDLQAKGLDTVEANEKLGFKADLREYGIGAQILRDVGVRKMRMLTNNPRKIVGLEGYGLEVVEQVPLVSELKTERGRRYMEAKRSLMGHLIDEIVKK